MNRLLLFQIFLIPIATWIAGTREATVNINLQPDKCIDCHINIVGHEVMHAVVDDACDNCHQQTGEPHPNGGINGFTLLDRIPDLCYYCHEELTTQDHGHQPVITGNCLACHNVHGSSEPKLLQNPEMDLCMSCHKSIRQLINSDGVVHSAIPDGGCILCHQPHGSAYYAMLTGQYPSEMYASVGSETFELCFMCHDSGIIEEVETDWVTNFRNGLRNLHYVHITGEKGRNCNMCHDLHGSSGKFLIEKSVAFGNWEMSMNFLPLENGGSCLPGCHGKQIYIRE